MRDRNEKRSPNLGASSLAATRAAALDERGAGAAGVAPTACQPAGGLGTITPAVPASGNCSMRTRWRCRALRNHQHAKITTVAPTITPTVDWQETVRLA